MGVTLPGPVCRFLAHFPIDLGTFARVCATVARPADQHGAVSSGFGGAFSPEVAAKYAKMNAASGSQHHCARYVMAAIARGFGAITDDVKPATLHASDALAKIVQSVLQVCDPVLENSNLLGEARTYGSVLEHLGFRRLLGETSNGSQPPIASSYQAKTGDIVIFQPTSNTTAGHIQIFDGAQWVSDFVQKDPFWPNSNPNSTWQKEKPAYAIFRFSN